VFTARQQLRNCVSNNGTHSRYDRSNTEDKLEQGQNNNAVLSDRSCEGRCQRRRSRAAHDGSHRRREDNRSNRIDARSALFAEPPDPQPLPHSNCSNQRARHRRPNTILTYARPPFETSVGSQSARRKSGHAGSLKRATQLLFGRPLRASSSCRRCNFGAEENDRIEHAVRHLTALALTNCSGDRLRHGCRGRSGWPHAPGVLRAVSKRWG
jgi:hypothetical protein